MKAVFVVLYILFYFSQNKTNQKTWKYFNKQKWFFIASKRGSGVNVEGRKFELNSTDILA